jgi:hypothetical protein
MDGPLGLPVSRRYTGKGPKNQRCEEKKSPPRCRSPQQKFYFGLVLLSRCDDFPISQSCFSSPVSIAADTYYTVSYTTGSPLFYYDSEYFEHGGVTNGNLTAPSYTDINGTTLDNGVYNYGGDFPIASQYYANFWVDLVFLPGSGQAIPATPAPAKHPVQPAAIVGLTPSQSSGLVISPPAATPAGPASYGALSRGAVPTFRGPLPSPRPSPIPQIGEIGSLFKKPSRWAE